MIDFSIDDVDQIIESINESFANVTSGEVTYSIRDCTINNVEIHKDDYMAIVNGQIVASVKDKIQILKQLIDSVEDIKEKQVIVLIFGSDVTDEEKEKSIELITSNYPWIEVGSFDGGQSVYSYFIDIE